jgi:alpha-galactosidase
MTKIVVIGGGSYQWVPKLLTDMVNMRSLADADLVLEDVNEKAVSDMDDFARHLVGLAGVPMRVSSTTDQRAALEGADYVIVSISTGGFDSMRHDLEIPERHGIKQSVGDTVGPGGVMRALRNIPVLVGIARDMETLCPDAWMLNITNPMTTLCRAVTQETSVKTVGLCHEVTGTQFALSQLLDAQFVDFDLTIVGVNHLPLVTDIGIGGKDGFGRLRALLDDAETRGDEPANMPPGYPDFGITKRDVLRDHRVKLAMFERFGVLPAAGDRHLVEFFPGFLTEESDWGARWGVALTTIADRERDQDNYVADLARQRNLTEIPKMPSGEMVAPIIDSFLRDKPRDLPLNLPNTGQCPDLPYDAVVEAMCTADGSGLRGRDAATAPSVLAEWLRRIVAAQEATVRAALSGKREDVVEAMMLDPLAGRIDYDHLEQMTDEMLAATSRWLPQFA